MRSFPVATSRQFSAPAAVLAGALCLSVSAILVKLAGTDAATTAVLRCAIAVVALAPLALRERAMRGPLSRAGVGWALVAGIALGVDYAAWTASVFHVGAGISTVLINIQVVVLPALAFAVDREKAPTRFLVALPVMLVGIVLAGGLVSGGVREPHVVVGTVLGVVAGTGYAVYLFVTRRAARLDPGHMIQPLTWATAAATLTATVIAPLSGGIDLAGIPARSWALVTALAVSGQVLAWLLIHQGSVRLAPATTAALLLVQPILALALSALILHENPDPLQLVGVATVLLGVAVASGVLRRRQRILSVP